MFNEVDAFVERIKCRFLREGSWKSLEEIFANIPANVLPPTGIAHHNDQAMESPDIQSSLLSYWVLANR